MVLIWSKAKKSIKLPVYPSLPYCIFKIIPNSKKQPSDGKTKRKCDVKSKANNAETNPEKQNTEKMNADKKESHKTEQKEKPTVLSEKCGTL